MLRPLLICLPLLCGLPPALADNMFCGGARNPASPDDLDNAVGELSLQYVASQPAGPVSCAAGYLLSKCGDHETANRVFDKCIAAGYTGALIWKALMYENGHGVPKDAARAADMLYRAVISGDPYYGPLGKMHYATALLQGRGVPRDEQAAMRWFREAAAEGDETAQEFLRTGRHTGVRDETGRGVGEGDAAGDPTVRRDSAADRALDAAAGELSLELESEGVSRSARPAAPRAVPVPGARRMGGDGAPSAARPVSPPPPADGAVAAALPPTGRRLTETMLAPAPGATTPGSALWLLPMLIAFVTGALVRVRWPRTEARGRRAEALHRPLLRRVA